MDDNNATRQPNNQFSEDERKAGAKAFEEFWLRPKKKANSIEKVRMMITKKWNGWKLKDELVNSLGLAIGDTINTEVSILDGPGLIEQADDTDLFASGDGADWLLQNNIGFGSVIDAEVRFVYSRAPVGGLAGREVWKLSLVFIKGYAIIRDRAADNASI